MRPTLTIVFSLLFATACDPSYDSHLASIADATSACERSCAWESDCSLVDFDSCVDDCVADASWQRGDAIDAYATCLEHLSCDGDEDTCQSAVQPLPQHQAFETSCLAALAECDGQDDFDCSVEADPDDPDAGLVRWASDEVLARMTACLAEPVCDDRVDCLDDILDTYDI